jgi:hypothetical protein
MPATGEWHCRRIQEFPDLPELVTGMAEAPLSSGKLAIDLEQIFTHNSNGEVRSLYLWMIDHHR